MPPVVTEDLRSATTLPSIVEPLPDAPLQVTTAAMESFKCLVDQCEDNCCRDWAVPINKADIAGMKAVMSSTPAGRERLVSLVVIGSPSRSSDGLAHIQMNERNACPVLEPDNRCGVHATFGEEALTTSCSVFPRTALAVGNRVEVGGSLACPEVSRLTLLSQAETQLRPAGRPMLPRPYVGKAIPVESADAYAQHFVAVRAALLQCFQHDLALGTRFVLAADFAERVQPFFHAGTHDFHGAQGAFGEHRLRAEIAHTNFQPLHAGLDRDLAMLAASGEVIASFVTAFLLNRRLLPHGPRFGDLVTEVFASVAHEAMGGVPAGKPGAEETPSPTPGHVWQVYARRRAALDARVGGRATHVFSRYCEHYVMRNPYTDAATLLEHLYGLGINLAAIRFLTLCHPRIDARLAGDPDSRQDQAVFDEVAVHVTQTFTKAISHHPEYLEAAIRGSAAGGRGVSFGQLVLLAKFV